RGGRQHAGGVRRADQGRPGEVGQGGEGCEGDAGVVEKTLPKTHIRLTRTAASRCAGRCYWSSSNPGSFAADLSKVTVLPPELAATTCPIRASLKSAGDAPHVLSAFHTRSALSTFSC